MSKFLKLVDLRTDLSNITGQGINIIEDIVNNEYLNPITGKIKQDLLPATNALVDVKTFNTIAERDAFSATNGDVGVVLDVNETYIYNGTIWVEVLTSDVLNTLNDVTLTNPQNEDVLMYNGITNQWFNDNSVGNHLNATGFDTVHEIFNNRALLRLINQDVSTTSLPSFVGVVATTYQILSAFAPNPAFFGIYRTVFGTVALQDSIGIIDLRQLEIDRHTHANKTLLDAINQNLSTNSGVVHLTVSVFNTFRLFSNFTNTFPNDGEIWREGVSPNLDLFYRQDTTTYNLTTVFKNTHTHSNKIFLDSIDQNLSTGSNVNFNIINPFQVNFTAVNNLKTILFRELDLDSYAGIGLVTGGSNAMIFRTYGPAGGSFSGYSFQYSETNGMPRGIASIDPDCIRMDSTLSGIKKDGLFTIESSTLAGDLGFFSTNGGEVKCSRALTIGETGQNTSAALYVGQSLIAGVTLTQQFSVFNRRFSIPSDERIKKDIVNIDPSDIFDRISSLNPVQFKYKFDANTIKKGYIAQHLENNPYYNSCVKTGNDFNYIDAEGNNQVVENMKILDDEIIEVDIVVCLKKLIEENIALKSRLLALENAVF